MIFFRMTQSNPQLSSENHAANGAGSPTNAGTTMNGTGTPPPSKNSSNRVEGRDYLLQPSATVALLPSIAEEKNGFPHNIPYKKSQSLVENQQINRFMSPPPPGEDKEVN